MIILYCASQIKVCCHHASKLADNSAEESQAISIDKFIKMHLRVLKLMRTINSIFEIANFGQLLSTFGLFVVLSFQTQFGIDYRLLIIFSSIMLQLFVYCYLSERICTLVRTIKFVNGISRFFSIWYFFTVPDAPVFTLLIKVVQHRKHRFKEENFIHIPHDARRERSLDSWNN